MRIVNNIIFFAVFSMVLAACEKEDVDTEKPSIDISMVEAFPQNCEVLYFDEPFTIKALLSDNVELGSFNVDIHNNFDHHTHSTEIEVCPLDEVKTPVNPCVIIQDYAIPEGRSEYAIELILTISSSNGTNLYDEGDYHFHISVTDKEGWSSQVGLHVKILH